MRKSKILGRFLGPWRGVALLIALTPYATWLVAISVLYVALAPAHGWLTHRMGPRVAASLVVVFTVFLFVVAGGSFAGLIVNQAQPIAANVTQSPIIARLSELRPGGVDVGARLADLGAKVVSWIGSSAFGFIGSASRFALNLTISFFGVFYLLLRPRSRPCTMLATSAMFIWKPSGATTRAC